MPPSPVSPPSRRAFVTGRLARVPDDDAAGGPRAARIGEACLPLSGIDCQLCRDACATGAIAFRPVRGAPFRPFLRAAACTGCGDCVPACPTGAIRLADVAETADG